MNKQIVTGVDNKTFLAVGSQMLDPANLGHAPQLDAQLASHGTAATLTNIGQGGAYVAMIQTRPLPVQRAILATPGVVSELILDHRLADVQRMIAAQPAEGQQAIRAVRGVQDMIARHIAQPA